ncbi:MAG TPA: alcohol dehydrogenase catalytic domain-containing protein [Solirubrobacteraceae bacterium]|nr:alcohol dehydrogenase catalytic domain-containing protein [Solirubrobacteraceae bacterium]
MSPPGAPARSADRAVAMRACVLREPGRVGTETVSLAPPRAGEVRVRIAAAGVCHSDLHLVDGALGRGRWPLVPGHEGAGVVEAIGEGVTELAPGDHVVFSLVAPCGACPACRAGRRTLCGPAGARGVAGTLADGSSRLAAADGATLQHGLTVACFAERAVVSAGSAIPIPRELPLWQAALLGCGVITGFGAVAHAARVRIGERVCVVGCGGVGLQVIAAARLAGAATIVAVDRRADKLERALARGATDAVDASAGDAARAVVAITGGVDHAFEVVGAAATIRLAWDALAPGGTAVVVGVAPVGVEVSLPAIELLSEKSLVGSYYGSADPALTLSGLVQLVRDGRLDLGSVVSHLIELDDVPQALERLRTGEGGRSIVVLDPELAGVEAIGEIRPGASAAAIRTDPPDAGVADLIPRGAGIGHSNGEDER